MGRWIDRLRRPTADNTANSWTSQVVGNKADALAEGAVTETDTIVAYIKQLVSGQIAVDALMDVPAKDNILNAQINEVLGNKTDTTAVGAVTETDTVIGYIKQLVADAIAATAAIGVVDGLHDVPVADATANLYLRDIVGIKTDAAINAVTTTKTLMAYLKGVVNELTVPGVDNTDNAFINDVVGQKTDAAAADAVTATDTLVGYIKQLVTAAIADAAQTLKLDGVTISTAPTAASLASFIASGGTALGTQLPDSTSLYGVVSGVQAAVASSKLGLKVIKATFDALDGTQVPVFTVAGGKVLVTSIVMQVDAFALGAASDVKFMSNPTVGTDSDLCAVLAVAADELGSLYSITGEPATALTGGSGGGANSMISPIIMPEGTIDVDSSADTNVANGATESFEIYYIPLDAGATIVAI